MRHQRYTLNGRSLLYIFRALAWIGILQVRLPIMNGQRNGNRKEAKLTLFQQKEAAGVKVSLAHNSNHKQ